MIQGSSSSHSLVCERYLDVLASVYIYNEHRGYTALDRVLAAVERRCADDQAFIAAVRKHRADEHKHYGMFRRWFERQGRMPLKLDSNVGHIDRFIFNAFGQDIDTLDTEAILASDAAFETLLRVIILTEQRGYRQLEILLGNRFVLSDPVLTRIFTLIRTDEPDHFEPYCRWLEVRNRPVTQWREKWIDFRIHRTLLLATIPAIFLDPAVPRMTVWPHESDLGNRS